MYEIEPSLRATLTSIGLHRPVLVGSEVLMRCHKETAMKSGKFFILANNGALYDGGSSTPGDPKANLNFSGGWPDRASAVKVASDTLAKNGASTYARPMFVVMATDEVKLAAPPVEVISYESVAEPVSQPAPAPAAPDPLPPAAAETAAHSEEGRSLM